MMGNPSDFTSALQMSKRVFLNRSKISAGRGMITLTGFLEVGSIKDCFFMKNTKQKEKLLKLMLIFFYYSQIIFKK